MPITERELQLITRTGPHCYMNPAMAVAYLNVLLDRAPDNRLTLQDCDFQKYILLHRECDPTLFTR
jgi:hypothetical protein